MLIHQQLSLLPSYFVPRGDTEDQLKYADSKKIMYFHICQVLRYIPFCEDFSPLICLAADESVTFLINGASVARTMRSLYTALIPHPQTLRT
jgi:hypothetical protein